MKNTFYVVAFGFLFFTIFNLTSCQKNIKPETYKDQYISIEELINRNYGEDYAEKIKLKYPKIDISSDSIKYPFVFKTEFFLSDIVGFNTGKTSYILKADVALYNEKAFYTVGQDTLFDFSDKIDLLVEYDYEGGRDSNDVFIKDFNYDGDFYHEKESDTLSQWSGSFEAKMYLNWKLKKYPFDVQTLNFKIKSKLDHVNLRFKESKEYPADFVKKLSLPEGFYVSSIDFSEEFINGSGYWQESDNQIKYSVANYSINIKRSGFSLFLKLFLGSFLALFLSVAVFFIPKEDFDARSQISIGAIFAAVGNKYFVDSNTISNVLTYSDIINNTVILLVVFNVFVMIAQRNSRLDFKIFESEKYAVFFSLFSFTTISLVIIFLYLT